MIVDGDDGPRVDPALVIEAIAWAELAAERDPDPASREAARDLREDLRGLLSAPALD